MKCTTNALLTREWSKLIRIAMFPKIRQKCPWVSHFVSCVPDYLGVNTAQHRTRLGRGSLGQARHCGEKLGEKKLGKGEEKNTIGEWSQPVHLSARFARGFSLFRPVFVAVVVVVFVCLFYMAVTLIYILIKSAQRLSWQENSWLFCEVLILDNRRVTLNFRELHWVLLM